MRGTEGLVQEHSQRVLEQVKRALMGKDYVLSWVMAAILARGHILMEDIPGVGKTTMALAFSKALGLQRSRVQFTPDVLPSDVTGFSVPDPATGALQYRPGAVVCNLFLADELNRATSRTQSALLEAMEEGAVTVDGQRHPLPKPFIVIATQNPTGAAGTQLLPDSQMDRFAVRLSLGYPAAEDETAMVMNRQAGAQEPEQVLTREQLQALIEVVDRTYVCPEAVRYIVALVRATRRHPGISRGASPRATLSVTALSKAIAQLRGRDYVVPQDIREVFMRSIPHRLLLEPREQAAGTQPQIFLKQILDKVPAPKLG